MKGIITEQEFQEYERQRLRQYALVLRKVSKEIPLSAIAEAIGVKWDVLANLRRGRNISFGTFCRLQKYLSDRGVLL